MVISSDKPETLNELIHLVDSGFGRPRPRHGLRLLYWLACECISYDGSLAILLCSPKEVTMGFTTSRIERTFCLLQKRSTSTTR
uniref:Uncharacterized protein n=1 Tax=Anguilla anguilla TaxID=7936 RepID=A0A0E9Y0K1_ANGAN